MVVGRRGLLFVSPSASGPTGGNQARQLQFGHFGPPVPAAELQALLHEAHLGRQLTSVAWSAQVMGQHRVAERFSRGRLYLAGDAAHAHYPSRRQGMNAAIQNVANLSWKLAFAAP